LDRELTKSKASFLIDQHQIGDGRTFVICEIGNNHNGDINKAIELLHLARSADADCVKFQMRDLESLYVEKRRLIKDEDLGSEYVRDLLSTFELSIEDHHKLFQESKKLGITYLCTPWDLQSVGILQKFGVTAFKTASADLTNLPLMEALANTKKPLITSTGMSKEDEIRAASDFLKKHGTDFVLLHCNSTYPAPFDDINLNWLMELKKIHRFYGYSGHERGTAVSIGAAALGAMVIERHLTLDRSMEGPDHAASLEHEEFTKLVEGIRQVEKALGQPKKVVSQGELINRETLAKSLVSTRSISKNTILKPEDIEVRSPGKGLNPLHFPKLIGKRLSRDMEKHDFFFESDLTGKPKRPKKYNFQLKWGVPVRYHDYNTFTNLISPDLFEFHLSYTDLDIKLEELNFKKSSTELIVHAPELFQDSHLLDLTAPDATYRKTSIENLQRVIDITKELNLRYFDTTNPKIVVNAGGFSMDNRIEEQEKSRRYETLFRSLSELDQIGVELIPQTMAPFPWHFGGQRLQNLLVLPDEIYNFCKASNYRMCLDISHSALACNHYGLDISDFLHKILPFTAHIHMGDASGVNGEGLQIGTGELDFKEIGAVIKKMQPYSGFIPEIWQGHKDSGSGFWTALERLDGLI